MAKSGQNIANGIISLLVLICGVSFSAVVACFLNKIAPIAASIINDNTDIGIGTGFITAHMPIWALGFAYMVPGLIGCIAALTRNKGMYITHMVFSILTLVVMGIAFLIGIFVLSALAVYSPDSCLADGQFCKCTDVTFTTFTCQELTSLYAMGVSAVVLVVLAWVLVLTNTILAGILICRQEPAQHGVVFQPMPATAVVQLGSVPGMGQHIGYMPPPYTPQTHDNVKLVNNMQY